MTYSLRIADLPSNERPRERLIASGPKSLSTAELIAILLGTGQGKGKLSAVGLGQYILNQLSQYERDPLSILRNITVKELTQIHGIGTAKATTILAAIELGKRVFQSRPPELAVVDSPQAAADALSQDLMWQISRTECNDVFICTMCQREEIFIITLVTHYLAAEKHTLHN